MESLPDGVLWRFASFLMLGWLAVFFGRTLRPGQVPLIEQIARVSEPAMTLPLRRYTRRLTAIWCGYFVIAAVLSLAFGHAHPGAGALVLLGSVVLFVGEHWLRPRLFPGQAFPSLLRQLRDTWSVWHPGKRSPD